MNNKKKVVGLFVSCGLFGSAGIASLVTGGLPLWFPIVINVVTIIAGAVGVSFVAPNESNR